MKLRDILQGVKNKTIPLDLYGHKIFHYEERILEEYESLLGGERGDNDGHWTDLHDKTMEEKNTEMRDCYRRDLERNYDVGKYIFCLHEFECYHCGRRMYWVFDGDRLSLRRYCDYKTKKEVLNTERCPLETPTPMVTKIKTGGHLVFTNYFMCEDHPDDDGTFFDYYINTINGRRNVAEYKATHHNIAYGQMSNMTVAVFINDARDSIIIGNPYISDKVTEKLSAEEYDKLTKEDWDNLCQIEGHKFLGEICLDIWRWEAGDRNSLGPLWDELKSRKDRTDIIEVECQPGEWEVTHYFDIRDLNECEYDQTVFSRLVLKKMKG